MPRDQATKSRRKRTQTPAADASQDPEAPGNVDKIRDILFGGQMRDYEKRFSKLEERLLGETATIREQTERRADSLEAYVKKEMERLATRLKDEQANRTVALKETAKEIRDTARALEKRLDHVDERSLKNDREIRKAVLDQSKAFATELQQQSEQLLARIEEDTAELRNDSVHRVTLAEMLGEMALRITDEMELPEKE